MGKGVDVLFFDALFILLISTFGSTAFPQPIIQPIINQIFAPYPTAPQVPAVKNCAWYDVVCIAASSAGPFAAIGIQISWAISLLFSFLSRFILIGTLIQIFILNGFAVTGTVPGGFLIVIFIAVNLYAVIDFVTIVRGSSLGI